MTDQARAAERPFTPFLDALVTRLGTLETTLHAAHETQCGCDDPGRPDFCVAQPRELYALLDPSSDPTTETFHVLEKTLGWE
jgi:hypothetical protein